MKNFLSNPWVIGIGVTVIGGVIGGLILRYVFSVEKSKNKEDRKRAGVIDEGLNSTYVDCEGIGPDAGLISKGNGLRSINST